MKRKLFLLAAVLSLPFAIPSVTPSVMAVPLYIICETCTTSNPAYPCKCRSNGVISNCGSWLRACGAPR